MPLDAICALELIIHSWLQNSRKTFCEKLCQYLYRSTYDPDGKKSPRGVKEMHYEVKKRKGKTFILGDRNSQE